MAGSLSLAEVAPRTNNIAHDPVEWTTNTWWLSLLLLLMMKESEEVTAFIETINYTQQGTLTMSPHHYSHHHSTYLFSSGVLSPSLARCLPPWTSSTEPTVSPWTQHNTQQDTNLDFGQCNIVIRAKHLGRYC